MSIRSAFSLKLNRASSGAGRFPRPAAALMLLGVVCLSGVGAGCIYQEALTEKASGPVDAALLGIWQEKDSTDESDRMMVLKFTDDSYAIHYPMNDDDDNGMYFRGYPIEMGGVKCVQTELIGWDNYQGPAPEEDRKFHVVSYEIKDGGDDLVLKILNTDLVMKELTDAAELRQAFLKHKDNPELFTYPGVFVRVKPEE